VIKGKRGTHQHRDGDEEKEKKRESGEKVREERMLLSVGRPVSVSS
jgi:hypothetical protein